MLIVSFDIGIINLGACIVKDDKIVSWKVIRLMEKCSKNTSISVLADVIYSQMDLFLNDIEPTDKIDYVLLENQPSRINGGMKTVQMILFGYFQNLKHYDTRVSSIVQVNPKLKLAWVENIDKTGLSKQEQYKQNKEVSVSICSKFIQNDERLCTLFRENGKKQDDLADSFLQIIGFAKNKKLSLKILEYI